ncbi:MAG: hypothetical protein ACJ8AW_17190 [Rhodopila sp.]
MPGDDPVHSSLAPGDGMAVSGRGYAIALAGFVLFILYGSLYPFQFVL